jgi:Ca2+-binding RTX toxin-like protein
VFGASMTTRRRLALAGAVGALLATAPAAHAATARKSGDTITYTAAAGEANQLTITQAGGDVVLDESSASITITDGGGCPITAGNARCPQAGVTKIVVNLDDRDDRLFPFDVTVLSPVTATGGSGNDTLFGTQQPDTIDGGDGSDSLHSLSGDDTLTGGAGNDQFDGGDGKDTISGGPGADSFEGNQGPDVLNGEAGNDNFFDGDGDDIVDGGDGDDSVSYGSGADTYSGGPGYDYVQYDGAPGDVSLTQDGVANDGTAGEGDNIGADFEGINAGPGNDTVVAGPQANSIYGADGNDNISGGGGADQINGAGGNDIVNGDAGGDYIGGDNGDDIVNGGADGDILFASAGSDVLNGDDGSDRFRAGGSNEGSDRFNGGGGTDTVTWEDYDQSVIVTIDGLANDGIAGANDNVALDVEGVVGGSSDDALTGGPGANVIEGGPGNDAIAIRDGSADIATCGDGSDTVVADGQDAIDPVGAGCENVDRGPVANTGRKLARIGGVSHRRGVVKLSIACPIDALGGCSGTAALTSPGLGNVGKAQFLMPAASAQTITIRLSKKARAKLAKAKAKRLKVTLTLSGSDLRGALVAATYTVNVKR